MSVPDMPFTFPGFTHHLVLAQLALTAVGSLSTGISPPAHTQFIAHIEWPSPHRAHKRDGDSFSQHHFVFQPLLSSFDHQSSSSPLQSSAPVLRSAPEPVLVVGRTAGGRTLLRQLVIVAQLGVPDKVLAVVALRGPRPAQRVLQSEPRFTAASRAFPRQHGARALPWRRPHSTSTANDTRATRSRVKLDHTELQYDY